MSAVKKKGHVDPLMAELNEAMTTVSTVSPATGRAYELPVSIPTTPETPTLEPEGGSRRRGGSAVTPRSLMWSRGQRSYRKPEHADSPPEGFVQNRTNPVIGGLEITVRPFRISGTGLRPGDILRNGKVVASRTPIDISQTPGLAVKLKCTSMVAIHFVGELMPVVFTEHVKFFIQRTEHPDEIVRLAKQSINGV